jgi:ribosomal protein L37E
MEIRCGNCGSENLTRDPEAPKSQDIPLLCRDCGWRGFRTPRQSCRRCGSGDVDESPIESWAYADLEDARENPETADWGYVDKTVFRCRKCHFEWTTAGAYRPYETPRDKVEGT